MTTVSSAQSTTLALATFLFKSLPDSNVNHVKGGLTSAWVATTQPEGALTAPLTKTLTKARMLQPFGLLQTQLVATLVTSQR